MASYDQTNEVLHVSPTEYLGIRGAVSLCEAAVARGTVAPEELARVFAQAMCALVGLDIVKAMLNHEVSVQVHWPAEAVAEMKIDGRRLRVFQ